MSSGQIVGIVGGLLGALIGLFGAAVGIGGALVGIYFGIKNQKQAQIHSDDAKRAAYQVATARRRWRGQFRCRGSRRWPVVARPSTLSAWTYSGRSSWSMTETKGNHEHFARFH
jgi:hypothetical protein